MHPSKVSLPVIKRLPRYFRYISAMKAAGVTTVSSSELAAMMGTTASQVRQDFNCFGGFGQQGIGYNVQSLAGKLEDLLFSGQPLNTILIGTGRLGNTIMHFMQREAKGYNLIAAFDKASVEIGRTIVGITVQDIRDMPAWCKQNHPQVAVLCVPAQSAEELAPQLVDLGVSGFWNFSHYDLAANHKNVVTENVHMADSLASLGFRLRHPEES